MAGWVGFTGEYVEKKILERCFANLVVSIHMFEKWLCVASGDHVCRDRALKNGSRTSHSFFVQHWNVCLGIIHELTALGDINSNVTIEKVQYIAVVGKMPARE